MSLVLSRIRADTFEEPVPVGLREGSRLLLAVPIEGSAELAVRIDGAAVDVDPGASSQDIIVPRTPARSSCGCAPATIAAPTTRD
jgi:hypothetical protein